MRALFIALALTLAPLHAAVQAQDAAPKGDALPSPPLPPAAKRPAEKPADAAAPAAKPNETAKAEPDRGKRLDALFAALKAAPTAESAKAISQRIEVSWSPSDSDTADLLMTRASAAMEAKQFDLAVELLDGVLAVTPDHLDAWNKRATVFYLQDDFADSLSDLRQVVAREPRHYGAWAGIALICKEIGDEKHALEAARRALAIYPLLEQISEMEKTLTISVEGRPI